MVNEIGASLIDPNLPSYPTLKTTTLAPSCESESEASFQVYVNPLKEASAPDAVSHLLPHTPSTCILLTGNLMKSGCLRYAPSCSTDKELLTALDGTLERSLPHVPAKSSLDYDSPSGSCDASRHAPQSSLQTQLFSPLPMAILQDQKYLEKMVESERSELEISAKLFLPRTNLTPSAVKQAVHALCLYLKAGYVDSLVLSVFDPTPLRIDQDDLPFDNLALTLSVYGSLEELHQADVVRRLGVSDLSLLQLQSLLSQVSVRPSVNQIRAPFCSELPRDLIAYGKKVDIEMTSHTDPKVILDTNKLHHILQKHHLPNAAHFHPAWILRYSFFIRSRGIMSNKGYIVSVMFSSLSPD